MHTKDYLAWYLALIALLSVAPVAHATQLEQQRSQYQEALKALRAGRSSEFERLQTQLLNYPLYPYLVHAELKRGLGTGKAVAVRDFLSRYQQLPIADDLRRDWLRLLGRKHHWQDYRQDYRPQSSTELQCFALRAHLASGQSLPIDDNNRGLWLIGRSQIDACNPVFAYWRRTGQLDSALYYQRAIKALAAGELRFARYLASGMNPEHRQALDRRIGLRTDPIGQLPRARHWVDTETNREIIASTLIRLAPRDSDRARHLWQNLVPHFAWPEPQRVLIEQRIALMRATDYPADALAGLLGLPAAAVNAQIREWRVRVALHSGDWAQVLRQLDALDSQQADRQRWRYWRARALNQTGSPRAAQALFQSLAKEPNYYGFLSAGKSGQPYALCPRLRELDATAIGQLMALPGLARALELFHLEQIDYARREWQRMLRPLDAEQRRQAAVLASDEGWHERAILTLADSGHWTQYRQRFPLAWQSQVESQARQRQLDPALIYGVMRSESAMAADAISTADARGLMQLTPTTGRQVARRYGLPSPSKRDLLKPDANIALGSAYLDQLFGEQQNLLLVLASYNAGPEPVARWQQRGMPLEADLWIETLPYHETREYLSRVLAFATIYDWRLYGRMQDLGSRMPATNSKPGKATSAGLPTILPVCPIVSKKGI